MTNFQAQEKRKLLFVSTRFLFPIDSGGKIRTTQTLRGMKDKDFHITLISPATQIQQRDFMNDLEGVCDKFVCWDVKERHRLFNITRMRHIFSELPIPIKTDWHEEGARKICELISQVDVVVFDFLHAAVLAPRLIDRPSVLFTHNVEAEIFARHLEAAKSPIFRWVWKNQYRKMIKYESQATDIFDVVVVVSERDGVKFKEDYGLKKSFCIPTGVDLEFFSYTKPTRFNDLVFCGSMDWMANQDAIEFFLDDIWPIIAADHPGVRFTIVGRNPPRHLLEKAKPYKDRVSFTGFVDDVRDFIRGAAVNVVPLRVGGGTRLKVYEAMSIGTPLVSTEIGVEGLPISDEHHYLKADDPKSFARSVSRLIDAPSLGLELSKRARAKVESQFSYENAARVFMEACNSSIEKIP